MRSGPESGDLPLRGQRPKRVGLLRKLWGMFRPGDVLLADRLMCTWTEMVMLKQRGVDCVCRLTSHRTADFRRGMRLGKDDHIVHWLKPTKTRSIDREDLRCTPRVPDDPRVPRSASSNLAFATSSVVVATTLLDADEYTKDDLAHALSGRAGTRNSI